MSGSVHIYPPVVATVDTGGLATEQKQDDIITELQLMSPAFKVEDTPSVSGDTGIHLLSVRQDTLSSLTDTDGDYASVKTNNVGELYIVDATARTSLSSIDGKLPTALGQTTKVGSLSVVLASDSDPVTITQAAIDTTEFVRNDYTSTNVTTGAYVELIASTASDISKMQIFDSSGQTLVIATGAAASEVDKFLIFPGGNGDVDVSISSGTRISIKAVSATADVGEISINLIG